MLKASSLIQRNRDTADDFNKDIGMVGSYDSRNQKSPINSNFPEASLETMS